MTAETNPAGSYPDDLLREMAEAHAIVETGYPDEDATVYDLHAIAADIWEEKAAALGDSFDFSETGVGDYRRSQKYQNYQRQAVYHLSRRKPRSRRPTKSPREAQVDVTL
jgi:glycine/D-amino acid oxidase-like deaminating enzyme